MALLRARAILCSRRVGDRGLGDWSNSPVSGFFCELKKFALCGKMRYIYIYIYMRHYLLRTSIVVTSIFWGLSAQAQWTESNFHESWSSTDVDRYSDTNETSESIWISGFMSFPYVRTVTESWWNTDFEGNYFPTSPNWRSGYETVFNNSGTRMVEFTNFNLAPGERLRIRLGKSFTIGSNHWTYSSQSLSGATTRTKNYETYSSTVSMLAVPN